jgi:hypothetical protein
VAKVYDRGAAAVESAMQFRERTADVETNVLKREC